MSSLSSSWSPTDAVRTRLADSVPADVYAGPKATDRYPRIVFRLGLGLLFLVNALVAWFDPAQFQELVVASGADRFVAPEHAIWMIRANDLTVGLLIVLAFDRWPRLVPAWAGLYLLSVSAVKVLAL